MPLKVQAFATSGVYVGVLNHARSMLQVPVLQICIAPNRTAYSYITLVWTIYSGKFYKRPISEAAPTMS